MDKLQRGGKTSTRRFLTEVNRYAYVLRIVTKDGKKVSFLLEDEEHALFWKNALATPLSVSTKVDMGRVVSSLNRSLEQISTRKTESPNLSAEREGSSQPPSLSDSGASSTSNSSSSIDSLLSNSSGSVPSRERQVTASTLKQHYLYSEYIIQNVSFEQSANSDIINLTRRLCERGKQEAGITLFGDYPTARNGVGDGHLRIISLDGGGLRAIMETVILARLMTVFPDLLQRVDVLVGVSGGAMVASGLACGRSPSFVMEMLQTFAPYFFKPKTRNTLQGLALRQAKFPSEPLEVFGREIFKGISIKDCPKKVIICSFLLDNGLDVEDRSWEPRVYHNIPLKPDQTISCEEELNTPLWEAVLGSAAAPTFYPSYKKHIDGAVMVNNPCLMAISMCTNEQAAEPADVSKMHILSLGTGQMNQFIDGEEHDWGVFQWASKLPEMMVQAGLLYQLKVVKMLLGSRFHQVNPFMEKFLAMDDPSLTTTLIELAQQMDLRPTIEWIEEHFYQRHADKKAVRKEKRKTSVQTHTELKLDQSAWYYASLGTKDPINE